MENAGRVGEVGKVKRMGGKDDEGEGGRGVKREKE